MAKMYGSYESLDGGTIISGLSVLTGYPCDVIHLRAHGGTITADYCPLNVLELLHIINELIMIMN